VITSNAGDVARRMAMRARRVGSALESTAARIAVRLEEASRAALDAEVYSGPMPPGRPRSGRLRNSERARRVGRDVVLRNEAPYAAARYALGKPGGRAIRSPGIRPANWQENAVKRQRRHVLEERHRAVLDGLRR